MKSFEVNFDGIVGPTHNYSGLSFGNVASVTNKQTVSNPKQAALQGLSKMKFLMDMGLKQAILPPQERPHIPTLKSLGFRGTDQTILASAYHQAPELFFACCSASSMWAANAATVSPSSDSEDKRVHITPANLTYKFHRSIEAPMTTALLRAIFCHPQYFVVHSPLPSSPAFSDEGAANHTRFGRSEEEHGVHLFVYGREAMGPHRDARTTVHFPARHTLEASQAITRLHKIPPEQIVYAQQNPKVIDAGVFHNDVISVGHHNVFFYHEESFLDTGGTIDELRNKVRLCCKSELILIKVPTRKVSVEDAVASYLFNSQIVTPPQQPMQLISPIECLEIESVHSFLDEMLADTQCPIKEIHYLNLRESMRNGGRSSLPTFKSSSDGG